MLFFDFFYLLFLVFYLLVSVHSFYQIYSRRIGKTFNILLFLAITIDAVVFTYSKRKSLSLCNFATFYFFRIQCFFGDVGFHYWNGIILLLQHILYFRSIFPSPVLNGGPLSNTLLAWFCKGDKRLKKQLVIRTCC